MTKYTTVGPNVSNVNIKRAVEHIRTTTTVYTAVIEIIVNAIQAIDECGHDYGQVSIRTIRDSQSELDGSLPQVTGFEIRDNGVGFTQAHRDSFDTLYTDRRISEGGKGFGRFICLKYFGGLHIESVYLDGARVMSRSFSMGTGYDIIVGERITESEHPHSGTVVRLSHLKRGDSFDKRPDTIARRLVERLLPYFITQDYVCPDIVLSEHDGGQAIRLNDFIDTQTSICEIPTQDNRFALTAIDCEENFVVRIFKFYVPNNQKSRVSLVAHRREVSGSVIQKYIPEFEDEFYDRDREAADHRGRNYIIKAYVFGTYLDRNVSLERAGFEFGMDSDLLNGISQSEIERKSAFIARDAIGDEIHLRQEKKRERIQSYVDEEAPWYKDILNRIDLSAMPYKPTSEQIEALMQRTKFAQEIAIKTDVERILAKTSFQDLEPTVAAIVSKITGTSKTDLIHYIALRRKILDIFGKSLETDESGVYSVEGVVHDIIFPRKSDTERTAFDDHNLWIIDERLNFTEYVSSDIPLDGGNSERPDLLVFNKRVMFRGDNEASNPITIFEFKRPQRDDFANPSSQDDPVEQIVRYVNDIRDGKYKTPKGRKIEVADNSPFYGFVVCDLTPKVEEWLERRKEFQPMPDRCGWFQWRRNINLYVEVISWDKVLKDAQMRNRIFFQKLGI